MSFGPAGPEKTTTIRTGPDLSARVGSLEQMRDEHQRQLLELGGLFSQMQDTLLTMTRAMGAQQRTISMLISEYERNIGDIANLPEQPAPADDELAASRETES